MNLDHARTALLVMDFQADIVAMLGDKGPPLVERTARLVAAARKASVPVVYITVGFRAGYPEVDLANPMFAAAAKSGRFITGTPGTEVTPALAPHANDVVIVKHRVGAFTGTDLEIVLRAKKIETLVLSGIATYGVVLSTVRHASDADYRLVVVEDCCGDPDEEVHRVLTQKVFPRQAEVVASSEVIAALG
jgi:nicotinamidase-related amidase